MKTSASFRWDGTLASSQSFGLLLAERFGLPIMAEPVIAQRWADASTLERLCAACRAWSKRPDAFAAMIMGEAVGWVE